MTDRESGASIRCEACQGVGYHQRRGGRYERWLSNSVNGYVRVPCELCNGSGREPSNVVGREPASVRERGKEKNDDPAR